MLTARTDVVRDDSQTEIDREIIMLKKLVLGGAAAATFAGLGLVTPAHAALAPWPNNENEFNVSGQSGNTVVCGNKVLDDLLILLVPVTPVVVNDRDTVDCSIRAQQDQD